MTAHAADDHGAAAWLSSSSESSSSSDTETETSPEKIMPPPVATTESSSSTSSSPWNNTATSSSAPRGLRVLFLSSDTGGGHRASAESLANQFLRLYPGSEYLLLDIMTDHAPAPYNGLKSWYKHLSAHPTQWNIVYKVSNTTAYSRMQDVHLKLVSERAVRKRLLELQPDVVVSVHPLMNALPVLSCRKISCKTGKHLPMFTVVTDLGSAHSSWFDVGVEKLFVASDAIRQLAKTSRAKVPDSKLVQSGLPIRHDFAVQSELLGERCSEQGRQYQAQIRKKLKLDLEKKTVLVMGGGEGCGLLSDIVNALYVEFTLKGLDAQILVVCGRNQTLKEELDTRDWNLVLSESSSKMVESNRCVSLQDYGCLTVPTASSLSSSGCIQGGRVTNRLRKILSASSLAVDNPLAMVGTVADINMCGGDDEDEMPTTTMATTNEEVVLDNTNLDVTTSNSLVLPHVQVIGLGFVDNMAEYMVASDVLVSKAGPGTIAEAASLSLPVLLTSFLPGQEEGNVDFVVNGNFGAYHSDKDPSGIAQHVVEWLLDEDQLGNLSQAAKRAGKPHAAEEIVKIIGESTLRWRDMDEQRAMSSGLTPQKQPKRRVNHDVEREENVEGVEQQVTSSDEEEDDVILEGQVEEQVSSEEEEDDVILEGQVEEQVSSDEEQQDVQEGESEPPEEEASHEKEQLEEASQGGEDQQEEAVIDEKRQDL